MYKDQGLKWELIRSKQGRNGEKLYSLRITQKCRAVAVQEGAYLRFLSLIRCVPFYESTLQDRRSPYKIGDRTQEI